MNQSIVCILKARLWKYNDIELLNIRWNCRTYSVCIKRTSV